MKDITTFESLEFGAIRTQIINNEPWFVGKDVATALGYVKPLNALSTHVEKDDSLKQGITDSLGREQETIFVNESGLYALIFGSKLDSAKRFKRWVTKEVLPSIRKTGSYQKPTTIAEQIGLLATGYGDHEDRIKNLESNMVIDYGQQQCLRQHVNKAVLNALGGKNTEAYTYLARTVFSECNRDLQDRFKVNSRNNIPRKRYEEAVDYVDNWEPKTNTKLKIDEYNRQQRFNV